jgi:uncharacterized protein (DUF302 family)
MTGTLAARPFEYTVESKKPFDAVVHDLETRSAESGFRVLHTHDVAATLREKGFPREPLKIIEVCNAGYANEVLKKDVRIAVMLPCPIAVYSEGGQTRITALRPVAMSSFYADAGIEEVAKKVDEAITAIIDKAK